jgi:hypothetical protein
VIAPKTCPLVLLPCRQLQRVEKLYRAQFVDPCAQASSERTVLSHRRGTVPYRRCQIAGDINSACGSRVCYRTGSRASMYLVIVCAAAARHGVLSRYARLPDGYYEACNGVSAAAFAAASRLLTLPPVRCVGCNSDSGAQAPELDMLFEMIRTI